MAASKQDIEGWLRRGQTEGASHVIVVCDGFDHTDYPVYVQPGEVPRAKSRQYDGRNMQRIMECYALALPIDKQLAERRAFHWMPVPGPEPLDCKECGAPICRDGALAEGASINEHGFRCACGELAS